MRRPRARSRRIGQRPIRLRRGSLRQARWDDGVPPENMKHPRVGNQQVARDDPAMAPPPHRLRTRHSAASNAAQFAKPGEAGAKTSAHRIVGVVVKALVLPESVDIGRDVQRARASTAELRDLLICDLKRRQGSGKRFAIDVPINYVGHAEKWDELIIDGDVNSKDCLLRYKRDGRVLAVASIYRDVESLKAEVAMEQDNT